MPKSEEQVVLDQSTEEIVEEIERPAALPEVIWIGPYCYTVLLDAEKISDHAHNTGVLAYGYTDLYRYEIVLDPRLRPTKMRSTVWHEVMHAVLDAVGRNTEEVDEEDFIRHTAPSLLAVVRDNPELMAFLTESD